MKNLISRFRWPTKKTATPIEQATLRAPTKPMKSRGPICSPIESGVRAELSIYGQNIKIVTYFSDDAGLTFYKVQTLRQGAGYKHVLQDSLYFLPWKEIKQVWTNPNIALDWELS